MDGRVITDGTAVPSPEDHAWSTALLDWQERVVARESLIPDLPLDEERANRALRIFKNLRVPDIEGNPTYGEICDDFVFDMVRAVFGAFDSDQRRMIIEYFLLIPKKNGKTSIAAALIVVALILNERPAATAIMIAPTKKIADTAFSHAAGIIRLSETPRGTPLSKLFTVHQHEKTIRYLSEAIPSEMSIKAADTDVVTGSKATYILIDETHEFASNTKASAVLLEVRGGLSHPDNKGFLLQITTQSKGVPRGAFRAELQRARDVRDGKIQAPVLAVLYELPPKMVKAGLWRDASTWGMVNPHLGRSVSKSFIADRLLAADQVGGDELAMVASQYLNVEIGQGLGDEGWAGAKHWAACARPGEVGLHQLIDACDVAVIGIDWGGADDLASLAILGRRISDKAWMHWTRSWARPSVYEARKSIVPALNDFVADGDLVLVATGEDQAAQAADLCMMLHDAGLLPEKAGIGLDAAGVALLVDALTDRGLTEPLVVAVSQGWKLQSAISTLPLKLEAGRMLHGGQAIMGWAVANAKQEMRGSNYVITKAAAGSAKIDPLMATFNAAMLMFLGPEPNRRRDIAAFLANPIIARTVKHA
jgi:phage terminase large subunit-like protein